MVLNYVCRLLSGMLFGLGLASTVAQAEITVARIDIGLPNTAVFQISGKFDGNEILRFKSAIADVPPNIRIIAALNSPGGVVSEGFALGKFFYEARIPTIVLNGHMCASSCTNAFFGGRDPITGEGMRIMTAGAKLGFHNFKSYGLTERAYTKADVEGFSHLSQKIVYAQLIHLKSIGAPVRAIALSLGTPHEGVYWLNEADALGLGITVLNLETGRLVAPGNIASRTR